MIKIERPRFLTLLCLLSTIGALLAIKSAIQGLFFNDEFDKESASYEFNFDSNGEVPSFFQNVIDRLFDFMLLQEENSILLNSSSLILSSIALYGVYLMYRLDRKGFIWFTIPKLLMIIIPFIYFFNNSVGMLFIAGQFFITALFVFMYATQLKYMHK